MPDPQPNFGILYDLPCLKCGYNLRGLDPTGDCPECGDSIQNSLGDDLATYLGRDWVHRVRAGFNTILLSLVVCLLGLVILVIVPTDFASGTGLLALLARLAPHFVFFCSSAILAVGGVLATSPPRDPQVRSHPTRWIIRASAILTAVLVFVLIVYNLFLAPSLVGLAFNFGVLATLIIFVCFASLAIFSVAVPWYVQQLARIIDLPDRESDSRRLVYFQSASVVLIALACVFWVFGTNVLPNSALEINLRMLFSLTTCCGGLGCIVSNLFVAYLLAQISRALATLLELH